VAISYVEDLAARYYMKKGYLVSQNIQFRLPRGEKKVAGWSDIDVFALARGESIIVNCKSGLGFKGAEKVANDLVEWFDNAVRFLQVSEKYRWWVQGTKIRKVIIVDWSVRKAERLLQETGIEVKLYEDILRELIGLLREELDARGEGRVGKEEDPLLRMLVAMIGKGFISEEKLSNLS
jgi:hypothetical protein